MVSLRGFFSLSGKILNFADMKLPDERKAHLTLLENYGGRMSAYEFMEKVKNTGRIARAGGRTDHAGGRE